jgi:1-aminocyclopropane-1-carboxylate deaminase/D-cysteine desulfhydrase-like pyridoxal-dependent ACC family enzyme
MFLKIFDQPGNTPVEYLETFRNNVQLFIKREDLIHPEVSGNKWRKLMYNLIEAHKLGNSKVLTFGGAFSNHIYATAAAGAACGISTIGVIRGEIVTPLNPTLQKASAWGMQLQSVTREQYKNKEDPQFLESLLAKYGPAYIIPEGGANQLALVGVSEMTNISEQFDYWCVSCGTGTTLAGLVSGLSASQTVLGFPALRGGGFLENEIDRLLNELDPLPETPWELVNNYHFGGYAKVTEDLVEFIHRFKSSYGILLDPIYTGKMMYGIFDLINTDFFPTGSRILAVHSGGLQGITGIEKKYGIKIK